MASFSPRRVLLALVLLPGVCLAQRYVPPPPQLTVDPCAVRTNPKAPIPVDPKSTTVVCPPASAAPAPSPAAGSDAPSAAQQFPFPGDAPAKPAAATPAAQQFPFPGDSAGAKAAPAAAPPAVPAAGSSAADKFPYPGETSKSPDAVPEGDTPRYVPDAPAAGSAQPGAKPNPAEDSSSSSSSSSADPLAPDSPAAADGAGDTPTKVPQRGRRALPKVSALSPDERVTEDLNVARFYTGRGNYVAAYMRSKDATKVMPDDPEGHFMLAQAAQKLEKKDEAVAEYTLYLKLDPAGDKSKLALAEKALAELR